MKITKSKLEKILGSSIKKSKYGNVRTAINGINFPSKLEANVYEKLEDFKKQGKIKFFIRQVMFDLPGSAKHYVDFCAFTDDDVIFIEAKGRDLPLGKLKRHQVEDLYDVNIFVVKLVGDLDKIIK